MATSVDIARAILDITGPIDAARLHKLTYYVQAWSLANQGSPAFTDPIKAWRNGPVVPEVYAQTKGHYEVKPSDIKGNATAVSSSVSEVIQFVLGHYGRRTTDSLIALTHFEEPWKLARKSSPSSSSPEITVASVREYFTGKTPADIDADYQIEIARGVSRKYAAALRRLAQ